MSELHSDALVFFGATGDLAYKKIFPALQAHGPPRPPERAGHRRGQGRLDPGPAQGAGARQRREARRPRPGGVRQVVCAAALRGRRLQRPGHVRGPAQGTRLGPTSGPLPRHPAGAVRRGRGAARQVGVRRGARVIVEKPFGRDLASAQALNRILLGNFDESAIFRIDHYLGQEAGAEPALSSASPTRSWSRSGTASYVESVQITMAEDFGVQGRGAFYEEAGAIRDVVQNHLLPGAGQPGDGAAGRHGQRVGPRREGEGPQGHPAPGPEQRGARPVPRLPRREGGVARTRRWRPSPRCGWRSTPGAGRACRSTSGPASACPSPARR